MRAKGHPRAVLQEARGQIPPAVLVEEGVQEVPVDFAVLREQEEHGSFPGSFRLEGCRDEPMLVPVLAQDRQSPYSPVK